MLNIRSTRRPRRATPRAGGRTRSCCGTDIIIIISSSSSSSIYCHYGCECECECEYDCCYLLIVITCIL